jgi:hypothetical protein
MLVQVSLEVVTAENHIAKVSLAIRHQERNEDGAIVGDPGLQPIQISQGKQTCSGTIQCFAERFLHFLPRSLAKNATRLPPRFAGSVLILSVDLRTTYRKIQRLKLLVSLNSGGYATVV